MLSVTHAKMQRKMLKFVERIAIALENISHDIKNIHLCMNNVENETLRSVNDKRETEVLNSASASCAKQQKKLETEVSYSAGVSITPEPQDETESEGELRPEEEKSTTHIVGIGDDEVFPMPRTKSESESDNMLRSHHLREEDGLTSASERFGRLVSDICTEDEHNYAAGSVYIISGSELICDVPEINSCTETKNTLEVADPADEREHLNCTEGDVERCTESSEVKRDAQSDMDEMCLLSFSTSEQNGTGRQMRTKREWGRKARGRQAAFKGKSLSVKRISSESDGGPQGKVPLLCDFCGRGFHSVVGLRMHRRFHTGEKLLACSVCDKVFARRDILVTHERTHTGEKPYECSHCDKRFAQKSNMLKHIQRKHMQKRNTKKSSQVNKETQCNVEEMCMMDAGQTDTTIESQRSDFQERDGRKEEVESEGEILPVVGISSENDGNQKESKEPLLCDVCGKYFFSNVALRNHWRTHTGEKPFACPTCHKTFSRRDILNTHRRVHTGEKPFGCFICGRRFAQKPNLRTHVRKHKIEKPFKCPKCSKAFALEDSLKAHMLMHAGKKPYSCSLCGIPFCYEASLKRHMHKTHGIDHSTPEGESIVLVP